MRTLPPLTALRAFEATVRLGSVTAAASELHVTHGAISRQLQLLEQALGQPVLEKAGRGLLPTRAGRQLQDTTHAAFEQLRHTWASLQPRQHDGPLTLGCPGSILARWMIPRLEPLRQAHPELTLHLAAVEGPPAQALDGVDAVLLLGQAPWPVHWQVRQLGQERIGPVFSAQLPQARQLAAAPAASLLEQALLHTTSRPQAWPAWLAAHGLGNARLGQGFDHLYYLLEAAHAGLGVAIAPYELVAADIASGRLLAPWGFTTTGGCWALCSRADHPDRRIGQLAHWLQGQLEQSAAGLSLQPSGHRPDAPAR